MRYYCREEGAVESPPAPSILGCVEIGAARPKIGFRVDFGEKEIGMVIFYGYRGGSGL